ncbi:hypothetical protein MBAV_006405 [Candidatus Magnetobacterium bavaricum]|uniref:Uncharacterized protein n=1 Tax=Candidatus Magnetobacterium bavaricum TaxID=29290 RepID=A0A0F3GL50_9BACT|nr:hypothetical protein MBAV_006405 [Candidatus Magnetobacterium bavaricum]
MLKSSPATLATPSLSLFNGNDNSVLKSNARSNDPTPTIATDTSMNLIARPLKASSLAWISSLTSGVNLTLPTFLPLAKTS